MTFVNVGICARTVIASGLLLLTALGVGGCGKSDALADLLSPKTFEVAAPEAKEAWDTVLRSAKANDYASAILTLQKLRTMTDLNPIQSNSVVQADTALRAQMTAAAKKGDANAQKAIEDLRKAFGELRGNRAPESE
jgi:hypothetical protein